MLKIQESRGWWRPEVYHAFMRSVAKISEAA
jgi:hypothetical protein